MGAPAVQQEQRVNLVTPDGEFVNVPAEEAQNALDAGYRLASGEEVAAEKEREHFQSTEQQVKAGAEGLLRGATLGVSDVAAAGIAGAENVRKRKEYNEGLALGTEVVGGVAPLLLPGGGLLAGGRGAMAAAKTAGAAPRAVAAVGGAVERGAASLLGKGVLARGASVAAGGAVEGAMIGAGQAISEAALNDTELTGEMVVSHTGTGALLGGAAGGVLGLGVGATAKAVQGVMSAGKAATKAAKGMLPEGALGSTVRKADDALPVGAVDDAAQAGTPPQESFAQRFTRQQKAVRELDDVQQAEIRSIRSDGTRKEELFDAISDDLDINNKLRAVQSAIDGDVAAGSIARSADETAGVASDLVADLKREVDLIAGSVTGFEQREIGAAKRLKKFVDEADLQVRKLRAGGGENRGEIFAHLDQLKRRVGKVQERIGGRGTSGPDDVVFTAGGILRSKYDEMAAHLVDESMYGRAAADIQAPDNQAWTNWFDTRDAYRKMFLTDAGGKRTATGFAQVDVMNPESVGSLVKGLGRAESELKEEMFRRSVEATDQLVEQLASSHTVGPKTASLVLENRELGQRMIAGLDKAKQTSMDARAQRELLEELRGIPMAEATVRGAVTLAENAAKLAGMRGQAKAVGGKLEKAAKTAVQGAKAGGRKAKTVAKQQAARAGKPRRERFDEAVERVTQASDNPVQTGERIAQRLGNHKVASAAVSTVVRGQAFLRSKMPAPLLRNSNKQQDKDTTPRVSSSEMAKWLRYVEAVDDPMSVVRSLEAGDMTREGAEVLREVYPKMYLALKDQVTMEIARSKGRIPRNRLVQLSILFDEPYHPSMEPGFLLAMQKSAQAHADREQGGDGFIAPSARNPPDTSADHMTTTQRIGQ